jgi:pimeloyl-ACP methyl ester carboxylesterase
VRRVEAGAGEPAVVLEAGMNCGAASWRRVMPLLAPHLRVAAYDRAGLGGSAPAPGLVTIDRMIDDLASVITGLAAGPCVLAGHSLGGLLAQLLAFRRPDLSAERQALSGCPGRGAAAARDAAWTAGPMSRER